MLQPPHVLQEGLIAHCCTLLALTHRLVLEVQRGQLAPAGTGAAQEDEQYLPRTTGPKGALERTRLACETNHECTRPLTCYAPLHQPFCFSVSQRHCWMPRRVCLPRAPPLLFSNRPGQSHNYVTFDLFNLNNLQGAQRCPMF